MSIQNVHSFISTVVVQISPSASIQDFNRLPIASRKYGLILTLTRLFNF
jgi:hypothetical protein